MIENGMLLGWDEEERVAFHCDCCSEPIYIGEDYYEIDDIKICEDCIRDYKKTAE